MKDLFSIGIISARNAFKQIKKEAPYFCEPLENKRVHITNLFFKHVVYKKRGKRSKQEFLKRFYIMILVPQILKSGNFIEKREDEKGVFHKISLEISGKWFSVILTEHFNKNDLLLVSCFLDNEKKDLLAPSMESRDQSRSSLSLNPILNNKKKSVNILIIGAGNMGGAIGKSLIENKLFSPENIFVVNRSLEKLQFFKDAGCSVSDNAEEFLPKADIVLLGIKPQQAQENLEKWKSFFKENTVLVSILAGTSVENLQFFSGLKKIIRVMPNTPLLVNKGISGFFTSDTVLEQEKNIIKNILESFGEAIECRDEDGIDKITALSGSGPAYFFRVLEIISQKAEKFGFSKPDSEKIALNTLLGAGLLAEKSEDDFSTLRKNVTSKGGTTQAALNNFEEENFSQVWENSIDAAHKRAKELS